MRAVGRNGVGGLAIASLLVVVILASASSAASAEPIQEPQRAQLRHFGFFHTAPEPLPAGPQMAFLRGCTGLNAQLAQKVDGVPGRRIFVIPGDGCLELVNHGPVDHPFPVIAGVVSTEEAIKHGMSAGGSRVGVGVVPDGVIAVSLSRALTVPVMGSAYSFSYRSAYLAPFWKKPRLVFGASTTGD